MVYSEKDTKDMVAVYTNAKDKDAAVASLAETYGRGVKSIIAKLSLEKVYIKKVYKSKVGEVPITKKELIFILSRQIGADPAKLQGLEKTPKAELKYLLECCGVESVQFAKVVS